MQDNWWLNRTSYNTRGSGVGREAWSQLHCLRSLCAACEATRANTVPATAHRACFAPSVLHTFMQPVFAHAIALYKCLATRFGILLHPHAVADAVHLWHSRARAVANTLERTPRTCPYTLTLLQYNNISTLNQGDGQDRIRC